MDPKGLRRLAVGKIPDYPDSIYCPFWQTSNKATRTWKDVCGTPNGVISDFNLWPEGQRVEVHGWRQCESFLPSLSSIAAWHQLVMHLVRAAYIPKRKLPYPSACCVHCPIPVSGTRGTREQGTRGTREQHQVLTVVVGHLLTSYQIVAGCREYLTGLVRVTPKVDAIGKRVGFAGIKAAVIPNPEEICRKMRLRKNTFLF